MHMQLQALKKKKVFYFNVNECGLHKYMHKAT
jgi:hypothetical protein